MSAHDPVAPIEVTVRRADYAYVDLDLTDLGPVDSRSPRYGLVDRGIEGRIEHRGWRAETSFGAGDRVRIDLPSIQTTIEIEVAPAPLYDCNGDPRDVRIVYDENGCFAGVQIGTRCEACGHVHTDDTADNPVQNHFDNFLCEQCLDRAYAAQREGLLADDEPVSPE